MYVCVKCLLKRNYKKLDERIVLLINAKMVQTRHMRRVQQKQYVDSVKKDDIRFLAWFSIAYLGFIMFITGALTPYTGLKLISIVFLITGILQGCLLNLVDE